MPTEPRPRWGLLAAVLIVAAVWLAFLFGKAIGL